MRLGSLCALAVVVTAACGDGSRVEMEVGPEGELVFRSSPGTSIATPGRTVDAIAVDYPGFIGTLEVDLDIRHSYVFDLLVTLEHEDSGVVVPLVAQPRSSSNDIQLRLSDEAAADIQDDVEMTGDDAAAYTQAVYRPVEPLRFFYGDQLDGSWRLSIVDRNEADGGTLESWALRFFAVDQPPPPAIAIARPRSVRSRIAVGVTEDQRVRFRLLSGLSGDVTLAASGVDGVTSQFTVDDGEAPIGTGIVSLIASEPSLGGNTLQFSASAAGAIDIQPVVTEFVASRSANVDLLAHLSPAQLGYPGFNGNDLWGWTDPLTGKEWALVGTEAGTSFVDVSDPANPVVAATLDGHANPSSWRDIKVYKDHAFIVSEAAGHGLQVLDLSQLRDVASAGVVSLGETAHFDGFGNAHNIVINEDTGFAYVVGATAQGFDNLCGGGLYVVDIRTPSSPSFVTCFGGATPVVTAPGGEYPTNAYIHDAQCVIYSGPDTRYTGRELCFSADGQTTQSSLDFFSVADVTNKNTVTQVTRIQYADSGYAHQGWLSENHRYYFLNDESDELTLGGRTRTLVFDLLDVEQPLLAGVFENPSRAIGHNSYVVGDQLYMANYTSGLRIVDLNSDGAGAIDVGAMDEVAFFDTFPGDDLNNAGDGVARFAGAWSVYPFFASGTLVVSDIEHGLFIVRRQ